MNDGIANDLRGRNISVHVTQTLGIEVRDPAGELTWSSAAATPPSVTLADGQVLPLHQASQIDVTAFERDGGKGHHIRLAGLGTTNAEIELTLTLNPDADLLTVHVEDTGERGLVKGIEHLYRFEKPTAAGGYLVVPHGSGYLIPAECPDELPGKREFNLFIGASWTLPMFGMVRGEDAMCLIVEDWWDCRVDAVHRPGDLSALDFNWAPSLGEFAYARRMQIHFAKGMDHTGMAKLYREHARSCGLVRTLEEKAKETPAIDRYIENILVRWGAWNPETKEQATSDLRRFLDMGFGVNFFFPKWPAGGYSEDQSGTTTANALWQSYLHPDPVPGGWPAIAEFSRQTKDLGCVIQGFVCPLAQEEGAPEFDPDLFAMKADGTRDEHRLSVHKAVERNRAVLESISANGLRYDVLYYDGYSAHCGATEDFTPEHPCGLRYGYDAQSRCFADARAAGIMPGTELARFWCIPDCDYFFFTDWSEDRLTNGDVCGDDAPVGEPIPLFQLVFHDCYISGFSGGGYANYQPGYDWWRDRTPRLYEMMYCAAPGFNWLPLCDVPVKDWDSAEAQARFAWLKRSSIFYRAIAKSEMTAHAFLSDDRKQQRVEFANGVTAEFDMAKDLCRVQGVEGFSGEWEKPAGDLGWYPCLTGEFDGEIWRP